MPSYLITGVSRGLGFEFLRQLSGDQNNIVVGIARDKASTGAKISQEMDGRSNITILEADITDYDALKVSASGRVSRI
jgi:NAD(P)-dependent dehydrogenase (short-subunit alcohol dehydrogenase family)